ncbi:Spy/CpxP family protein refolding chaperone [Janthinobacterium agaricidamnosum]|uniref:LTXXQ motif family protein n=1 Tax=Janthinobacterium agaricidamnosum NBRC 102515 = DSM 9628 TaxID=1349767 RepID=W0VE05_9BURK|nr:Spy/CpxP family protein refolding chaperone [Janthinobacterium agaricidamnosum]CDG85522.1 putative uncharacterized protein [Janthinobacterium agaricidamnosum NBRC 102515 = DSM 9628]
MNTFRKSLLIGLSVIGMGATTLGVQAQEAAPAPAAHTRPTPEQRAARMAGRMAKYQARLHDKLKLTAAQEPAWQTFIASATPKGPGARAGRNAIAAMSAPQRLEQWIALSKDRIAAQETRLAALKTFYAVLTPEQQKVFDDSVPGGQHGWHRAGHGGMGHDPAQQ